MMKLNKKGFTLVELLVVLVILVVIMSIAIPSVTSSLERSKEKQKNAKIELIESAAGIYFDRNKNNFDNPVEVDTLITDGLLTKEQAKDPFDEDKYVCSSVTNSDGVYVCNE